MFSSSLLDRPTTRISVISSRPSFCTPEDETSDGEGRRAPQGGWGYRPKGSE